MFLEVSYRTAGSFLVSFSLNLSRGGVFVETDSPLPVGTELTLRLQIPGSGEVMDEVEARVVWVRDGENAEGRPGMGLVFEGLSEKTGMVIDKLVSSFEGVHIVFVGGKGGKNRSHLAGRLRSLLKSKVTEVGGKISAIDQLTEKVDLVVADLDRAGQDGLAFLSWAAERMDKRPAMVALASCDEMQENARKLGADEVITGGGSPKEFRTAVLRALSRPIIKSIERGE